MNTWTPRDIGHGWMAYDRGNCRITVDPSGEALLAAPGCTTYHKSLKVAQQAAYSRLSRGW